MRKTLLFPLIIVLLVLPGVLGQEDQFEDWVNAGGTFTYQGETYKVSYNTGAERGFIESNSTKFVLKVGECDMENNIRGCMLDIDRDSKVIYKNGVAYPALKISIRKAQARIVATRTLKPSLDGENIDTKKLEIGDRVTFTLVLENTGDIAAQNLVYKDVYPRGISPSSANMEKIPDGIMWNGVLSPAAKREFTYTLTITGYANFISEPSITYSSLDEFLESDAEPITIAVRPPINIEAQTNPEYPDINQAFTYTIHIKNEGKSEAKVNKFIITLPAGLTVSSAEKEMEVNGNSYSYSKNIARGAEQDFDFKLKSVKEGSFEIMLEYDVTLDGINFKNKESTPLFFGDSDIIPIINLEKNEFTSGESFDIKAVLKNKGSEDFFDVKAELDAGKLVTKEIEENIYSDKEKVVYSKKITAPQVTQKETINIILKGSYEDNASKTHEFSTTRQITILPGQKAMQIKAEQSRDVNPGGRAKIDVNLENLLTTQISDIKIAYIPPKRLEMDEDSSSVTLNSKEKKMITNYLIIPSDFEDKLVVVKIVVNAKYGSNLYTETVNVPIRIGVNTGNPQEEPITEENNEEAEEQEIDVTKPKTQGKRGLLNVIFGWFKGLFS